MITFQEDVLMETHVCGGCGITYAVPQDWLNTKRRESGKIHCPNGCTRVYIESDADRLRKQLEAKERELRESKCETLRERSMREAVETAKAAAERKLRRVQRGVCPCCKRSFENLKRHMAAKHSSKNKD